MTRDMAASVRARLPGTEALGLDVHRKTDLIGRVKAGLPFKYLVNLEKRSGLTARRCLSTSSEKIHHGQVPTNWTYCVASALLTSNYCTRTVASPLSAHGRNRTLKSSTERPPTETAPGFTGKT